MSRLGRGLLWVIPALAAITLYWPVLDTWFQQDDFAWLGLADEVHSWRDLPGVLFRPQAQGTIRPWSERLPFLVSRTLFDLNAVPFRVLVLGTLVAALTLLQAIARRMTGSPLAGVAAALSWLVTPGLATPVSWASAHNQVQCALVLLLALFLLQKAIETGRRSYWVAQIAVFVLGFGSLEIVVVYPALAVAYCWLFARKYAVRCLALFVPSVLYTALHFAVAPKPTEGVYARHWDAAMVKTYYQYWQTALGALPVQARWGLSAGFWSGVSIVVGGALLVFLIVRLWRRDYVPLFGFLWFSIVLTPVLPLRDHFSDYYLAVPAAGLGLMMGWMVACSRAVGVPGLSAGVLVAAGYTGLALAPVRQTVTWRHGLGQVNRTLVFGVRDAMKRQPGKAILLTGIHSDAFWFGVYDSPFRLLGPATVKLVPGSEQQIEYHPELGHIPPYVASEGTTRRLLEANQAVVLELDGGAMRDVTQRFRAQALPLLKAEAPLFVDVGQALFADLLSGDWYPPDGGFRWMGKRGVVRLGTGTPGSRLRLSGYCPPECLQSGPLPLTIRIGDNLVGRFEITQNKPNFEFTVSFPPIPSGTTQVEVAVEVGRTFRLPDDPRVFGVTFGQFEVLSPITQK